MTPSPFYRRSGFWTAAVATVPLVYAAVDGSIPMPLVLSVLGAWATFFCAKVVRPSHSHDAVISAIEQARDRARVEEGQRD